MKHVVISLFLSYRKLPIYTIKNSVDFSLYHKFGSDKNAFCRQ